MADTFVDRTMTIGDLVRNEPARSRVFEMFGLDYCCGGKLPLEEACARRGLDVQSVLNGLAEADRSNARDDAPYVDANAMTLAELADHIEHTHHAYLRRELPRLDAMVRKVADVHGSRFPWMVEVYQVFAAFAAELDSHMAKEERVLFPLIRQLESSATGSLWMTVNLTAPIRVMEHEHDDAGSALARMSDLSSGFKPPDGACNTFHAMLDGLARLERDMHQHVHKENNVLFPRAIRLESERRQSERA